MKKILNKIDELLTQSGQKGSLKAFADQVAEGYDIFTSLTPKQQQYLREDYRNRIHTEELKAWYSEPEGESLFQGTSVSSLTIPWTLEKPIEFQSIDHLCEVIAQAFIEHHDRYKETVRSAIVEDVSKWIEEGIFFGFVLSAKVVTQALGLTINQHDVLFDVDGHHIDPHEITSYPEHIRKAYFEQCMKRLTCFDGIKLDREELEATLVLSDISKPKIEKYADQLMLAPVKCNEICAYISNTVLEMVRSTSNGKINPPGLATVIYDTDTPYTYYRIINQPPAGPVPLMPGLCILGSSGTPRALRWLYTYRLSLLSQKIMKGSLYSQVHSKFVPAVFYGVLVPRDAEILLDEPRLHYLRYKGNMNPANEFYNLVPGLAEGLGQAPEFSKSAFLQQHGI